MAQIVEVSERTANDMWKSVFRLPPSGCHIAAIRTGGSTPVASRPPCSGSNSGLVPVAISMRLVEQPVRFNRFGLRCAARQAHGRAADGPPGAAVHHRC